MHVHVHGMACTACVWHVHGMCMACVHDLCVACEWLSMHAISEHLTPQALLARDEAPLFSSAGDRAEILQRTMLIRRPSSALLAAELASHSAVHMVLAMCGTIVKLRQNDEMLLIEYAEQGTCK